MTTKKTEFMEQESNAAEATKATEMVNTEEEDAAISEDADNMDLNVLLENMDADLEEETFPGTDGTADFTEDLLEELEMDAVDKEISGENAEGDLAASQEETVPEASDVSKPKRNTRRKKKENDSASENMLDASIEKEPVSEMSQEQVEKTPEETGKESSLQQKVAMGETAAVSEETITSVASTPTSPTRKKTYTAPVLTLESRGEVETEAAKEDAIWHEIHNAYRTRKILTGQLGGIEQTDNGKTLVIVDYKGFRIIIPLKEMMINIGRNPSGQEYVEFMQRQNKILGNMLGAEIDFIVRGIDSKTRSVVASRREAMLKKRQIFYLDTDAAGLYRIYEGRIVQARVIAVAEKVIRVEVFGVECSIMARDLAWDWIGDAHERFSVGDEVLVRVLSVRRDSLEDIGIKADIKSVSQNTSHDNLKKCRIQSKYAGKVTDVHKGVVYIRLSNGVNAVAHSCFDYRTPGKKDDVSFAVTKLDEERGVAVGIITRIIRQNL